MPNNNRGSIITAAQLAACHRNTIANALRRGDLADLEPETVLAWNEQRQKGAGRPRTRARCEVCGATIQDKEQG